MFTVGEVVVTRRKLVGCFDLLVIGVAVVRVVNSVARRKEVRVEGSIFLVVVVQVACFCFVVVSQGGDVGIEQS